ncbi:unnamed protein product [Notodromas monacha]|nr:unnamed protein product [Notodromas monacha]CAG0923152.1 unnamed protein product [Notodromas monacha]
MSSVMSNKEAVQKTQEKINTWLGENRIVVFAAPGCPYCLKAKNALESVGCTDYKLVNVPSEKDAPVILTLLARMTRKKPTVPKVFVNGKFIGGGNALARLRDSGQLADMVKE